MNSPLLFYDGNCGLCDGLVRFLLWADRRGSLRFAPLRGETRKKLEEKGVGWPDSVVFYEGGRARFRSEAVIMALRSLGGFWFMAGGLRRIPAPLRDFAYDLMARHRVRWFGRKAHCDLPDGQHRKRFLP